MKMDKTLKILEILKIGLNIILIVLAVLFTNALQQILGKNCNAEYTVELNLCNRMRTLGTFCFVSMLLLFASWGLINLILPKFGENAIKKAKSIRIVFIMMLILLFIGLVITGNYFIHRLDRWL